MNKTSGEVHKTTQFIISLIRNNDRMVKSIVIELQSVFEVSLQILTGDSFR